MIAQNWLLSFEIIAVAAFALSGLLVAREQHLDTVGTFIAMFMTAFGGGTLRDVMLEYRPFYWVRHTELVWALIILALLAKVLLPVARQRYWRTLINVADAIGLGLFSATGAQLAYAHGWPFLPCVMMGVVTATFGGMLRDIVCHREVQLMTDAVPYASCAFFGNWLLMLLLERAWLGISASIALSAGVIALSRLVTARLNIRMATL